MLWPDFRTKEPRGERCNLANIIEMSTVLQIHFAKKRPEPNRSNSTTSPQIQTVVTDSEDIMSPTTTMTWEEIKTDLNRTISGSESINALIKRVEFKNSDERFVVGAAAYLSEHERPEECLQVIEARMKQGSPLSPIAQMDLRYLRGETLNSLGRYREAAAAYDEILSLEESDVAYNNRGLAHWNMGNFQEALNDYCKAVKMNPLNTIALRGAGEMLNRLGREAEAIRYLTEAVKLDPQYAAAYTALGVAYYNTEDWLKAYQTLRKAARLDPEDKIAALGIEKIERHFEL